MELSDDDCIGTLMLGCVAAHSHALLYVDSLQAPDSHSSSSSSKKKHRKKSDYERLVSLIAERLFAASTADAQHGGVHVARFDAAAHTASDTSEDDEDKEDADAEAVFDALCDALVQPAEGAAESELLFADAEDACSDVAEIRARQVAALAAQEAQHHALVLVEHAEHLLFASDVFAAHLARLLAPSARAVRRPGGSWRVLRDDVRAFSLIFVVPRTSEPLHLPSTLVCVLLFLCMPSVSCLTSR